MFDQMSREIAIGIQAFFHDIFADFAVVNTGDRILNRSPRTKPDIQPYA